jgi:dephospho-CoA kinase
MTLRVGLTGGIGSGKSTVAVLFSKLGAGIVDTDVISHRLTAVGGAAIPTIAAHFGAESLTQEGALNRSWMRSQIFSDPASKRQLEEILHPMIRAQAKAEAEASTAPYVLLVVPLLFETNGYLEWLDRTLAVDCPEATQLTRTTQRSGLDEATVRAIMAQQVSRDVRQQRADDLIHNDGELTDLAAQVARLHQHYLTLSSGSD